MDEPCGAAAGGAGAGFDGGFCDGLCAKAGESGPATSSAARKNASTDLAACNRGLTWPEWKLDCFRFSSKRQDFAVSQNVVMIIFPLKILSHWDALISF